MSKILLNLTAGTNVGLIRDNNEDNFTVCPDLSAGSWIIPQDANGDFQLGRLGCLTVVADGMGGMNAGEVASDLAIKTIESLFVPENISEEMLKNPEAIRAFMKRVIVEADSRIKTRSTTDPSTSGMGTTVVMAWIVEKTAHIAWCGDSRAYSYHPDAGLRQLSKDHSYVQELVDSGKLRPELAFDHPNSNIITSSLGDTEKPAAPDAVSVELHDGEIILLCSDGLCGMIRDTETEQIMATTYKDLAECKTKLIEGALAAGGHDNVTVALTKVVKGCSSMPKRVQAPVVNTADPNNPLEISQAVRDRSRLLKILLPIVAVLVVAAVVLVFFLKIHGNGKNSGVGTTWNDTIKTDECWYVTQYQIVKKGDTVHTVIDTIIQKKVTPKAPEQDNAPKNSQKTPTKKTSVVTPTDDQPQTQQEELTPIVTPTPTPTPTVTPTVTPTPTPTVTPTGGI